MNIAFIISRPSDFELAKRSQQQMKNHGWDAFILLDRSEWVTLPDGAIFGDYALPGAKQRGNYAAEGIVAAIIENSIGYDRVLKTDCDVFMTREISDWLACGDNAKCFRLDYGRPIAWGGIWSAKREHLIEAQKQLLAMDKCTCAEAFLILRSLVKCGKVDVHKTEIVRQYKGGEKNNIATLPLTATKRKLELVADIFDTT